MNADPNLVKAIFLEAVEQHDPDRWPAFLDRACAGQPDLRRRVEVLLEAHREAGTAPHLAAAVGPAPGISDPTERPGTVIGPYKLLQQIGEGGMGTVFMAEQTQPVQRKVALKVIKPGMDSRQVIARFEAERQALAMMDHVNIARVLDAGATKSGRPYFVMELVHGLPITKYCDDNRLTPRERLELFVPVCHAVQHAHQKGIIHRDIKPTNVMITLYDGKPVPKVIDFGVAKATEQRLTEQTLFTQYGTMVGTLEHMSPEQAEMSGLGVDTRSDIYSLGVLLYELLTGSTPLSRKRVREAAYGEVLRMIKEEEPPRPSTRLSDSGEALASISAQRKTEPAKLSKLMRGELDWIVMKALEKDRNRRYETANGFAMDVQCYLADEPVLACPPSAWYRARKFARRNKGVIAAAAAAVLVLILAVVGLMVSNVLITREKDQKDLALQDKQAALGQAQQERERAEDEAAIAKAVNDFFLNDLLAEAAPEKNARNKKVTVEELLGRAAARIDGKFDKQPRVEAAIRQTIGETYRLLGDYPRARPHLERSLELRRNVLGEEHSDTLSSMNNLALLYWEQGEYAKAEPYFVKTLDINRRVYGEEHLHTLTFMSNLALLYQDKLQYAKAEPLYTKTLEIRLRVQGEEHPDTLACMNNLAVLYKDQRQYLKAEPLYFKTLEINRRLLGEEHPDTLMSLNNLAVLNFAQGKYAQAESYFAKTCEVCRHVMGDEHPHTLSCMNSLAVVYRALGKNAEAEPLFITSLKGRRRILGEEHPDTLGSINNLARMYQDQGQYAKAEPLLREALGKSRKLHGEASPQYASVLDALGSNLLGQNKPAEAEPLLRECLALREKNEADAWSTFNTKSMLGAALLGRKNFAEAEPLLVQGYEGMKQREGKIPPQAKDLRLREALERLVRLYEATNQPEKARAWREKLSAHAAAAPLKIKDAKPELLPLPQEDR